MTRLDGDIRSDDFLRLDSMGPSRLDYGVYVGLEEARRNVLTNSPTIKEFMRRLPFDLFVSIASNATGLEDKCMTYGADCPEIQQSSLVNSDIIISLGCSNMVIIDVISDSVPSIIASKNRRALKSEIELVSTREVNVLGLVALPQSTFKLIFNHWSVTSSTEEDNVMLLRKKISECPGLSLGLRLDLCDPEIPLELVTPRVKAELEIP